MFRKLLTTRSLCTSAVIAALYAALTLLLAPISYGNLQCRISEAMTLLPMVMPAAIPGLFVGCLLANLLGGVTVWDIVFGSLATLIAAVGTYSLRNKPILAALCPVLSNGVIVGAVLSFVWGLPLWLTMLEVAVGEVGAVIIGFVLLAALKRVDLSRFQ
ncbi:MAG: QueT transporter family protein [Christensenellaceae bacterium]|nr:QueT transporter family protein [Christensenellaceae bacterium]